MAFAIENVTLFQNDMFTETELAIKENRIYTAHCPIKRMSCMKMDFKPFIMTPAFTMVDFNLPEMPDKEYFIDRFVLKGATSILAVSSIKYPHQLDKALYSLRTNLSSSPLSFIIGISISLKMLTSSFLLLCKKRKIPAIFVQLEPEHHLESIAWEWIRQAAFPYNPVLIPITDNPELILRWNRILARKKVPHLGNCLQECEPLSNSDLKRIGIYPFRGYLHQGGEISYNLFLKSSMEELPNGIFSGGYDRLVVTVLDGKIIRAGTRVDLDGITGKELTVRVPGFFTPS